MKRILMAICAIALTGTALYYLSGSDFQSDARKEFYKFKLRYNKSYGSKHELEYRFNIFKSELSKIQKINADPTKRYSVEVNKFADLTFQEFKNLYLMPSRKRKNKIKSEKIIQVKTGSIDWRETRGAVGPVKNQGHCGSCWAFSTVASLEFANFKKTGSYKSFSEQELVDCAGGSYGNAGCNGGLMDWAYDYIIDNNLDLEEDYPYKAVDQDCTPTDNNTRVSVNGYSYLNPARVDTLVEAIDKQVVSVSIEVQDDFRYYKEGVYHSENDDCGEYLNHGVAAVGYNTEGEDGYFIVRNSWGDDWGANGYINMAVDTGKGTCGIADDSDVYPNL